MRSLEHGLRDLIIEIVRDEVKRELAATKEPETYLSTRAAAKLADVAMGTVRRWVREGRLPEHRAGRVVRIKRSDLEKLLRSGSTSKHANDETPESIARRLFG